MSTRRQEGDGDAQPTTDRIRVEEIIDSIWGETLSEVEFAAMADQQMDLQMDIEMTMVDDEQVVHTTDDYTIIVTDYPEYNVPGVNNVDLSDAIIKMVRRNYRQLANRHGINDTGAYLLVLFH